MRMADQHLTNLRFPIGTRVECNTGDWVAGTVVKQFYVEKSRFAQGMCVPYQVKLDDGRVIFAPYDRDNIIRRVAQTVEMHEAVARGDVSTIKQLLEENKDMSCLSTLDPNGQSVMHAMVDLAVADPADGFAMVKAVVDIGKASPQVDGANLPALAIALALCTHSKEDGFTALQLAARKGSAELMAELLSILPADEELLLDLVNMKTKLQGGLCARHLRSLWLRRHAHAAVSSTHPTVRQAHISHRPVHAL